MTRCPDICPCSVMPENAALPDRTLCQEARFCSEDPPRFPVGVVLLAIIAGGGSAVAALTSGKSLLVALGVYSGIGVLTIALICLWVILMDAFADRQERSAR